MRTFIQNWCNLVLIVLYVFIALFVEPSKCYPSLKLRNWVETTVGGNNISAPKTKNNFVLYCDSKRCCSQSLCFISCVGFVHIGSRLLFCIAPQIVIALTTIATARILKAIILQ